MADEFNQGGVPVAQAPVVPQGTPVMPAAFPVAPAEAVQPYQVPDQMLPANAPDRTQENVNKLLENNRKLYEAQEYYKAELARRSQPAQVAPQAPSVQVNPEDFVKYDPITGDKFVDDVKLQARINEVNDRALRSEKMVQSLSQEVSQREIDRQNRETYAVYPELIPGTEQFNTEFNRLTRQTLTDAFYNPGDYGNRVLTFKEAADMVKEKYLSQPNPAMAATIDEEKRAAAEAGQAVKQQASSEIVNQPAPAREQESDDALIARLASATRMGDDEALAIRLKHTDHVIRNEET